MTEDPEEDVAAAFMEWRYRKMMGGLTHDEYMNEPSLMSNWFTQFEGLGE